MNKPSDLVQGTLDMLPLKIPALDPMNEFAFSQRLSKFQAMCLPVTPKEV